MVFAVRSAVMGNQKAQRLWLFATMACGLGFVVLHGREWTNLIAEGLTLPVSPTPPGEAGNAEFVNVTKTAPQFAATFFGLTGMHMLHVTLGVVYLGVVALRHKPVEDRRIVVDVTAWYWHFMALVWLYIFGLLEFVR